MFKRIVLEDWHHLVPLISFGTAFAIFVFLSLRTLLMKKKRVDELANLPLEDDPYEKTSQQHHE